MNCKGCGKNISGNDYKKVAQWNFCLECFEKLMNPLEHKTDHADRGSDTDENFQDEISGQEPPEKIKHSNICKICETEIEKGKEKKLGIWMLCESCYNEMTFTRKKTSNDPAEDLNTAVTDGGGDIGENESATETMERVQTGKTVLCSCCGRIILEIAAKKDGENLLCPDCFYNKE